MKITRKILEKIIKEEIEKTLSSEAPEIADPCPASDAIEDVANFKENPAKAWGELSTAYCNLEESVAKLEKEHNDTVEALQATMLEVRELREMIGK